MVDKFTEFDFVAVDPSVDAFVVVVSPAGCVGDEAVLARIEAWWLSEEGQDAILDVDMC